MAWLVTVTPITLPSLPVVYCNNNEPIIMGIGHKTKLAMGEREREGGREGERERERGGERGMERGREGDRKVERLLGGERGTG